MNNRLTYLLENIRHSKATDAEYQELLDLIRSDEDQLVAKDISAFYNMTPGREEGYPEEEMDPLFSTILRAGKTNPLNADLEPAAAPRVISFLQRTWLRYAAVVIILFSVAGYFYFKSSDKREIAVSAKPVPVKNDIAPGTNGAVLTLADGSTMILDSLGKGIVADQYGAQILLDNGRLSYNSSNADAVGMNTLVTPKGRQFQVVLPDGSKVWLNAASSLRYPTIFKGKERRVEIVGEAYFEIAKDPDMPFKVKVDEQTEVEVLGTNFNVNAYVNEEQIHTTLLEGAIRINANKHPQTLKPGEQAQINRKGSITVMSNADIARVMAWKNGLFNFEGASLKEVMNQLERWYDIEVIYEKDVPAIYFGGKMSRNVPLSDVLTALTDSDVHIKMGEGRKLIVGPQ